MGATIHDGGEGSATVERLALNLRAFAHARGAEPRDDDEEVALAASRAIIERAASQISTTKAVTPRVNCFGIPDTYRGWSIEQGPDDHFYGTGPNYDASYEGPEDGWVDNGERCIGVTWDDLRDEIDTWFEEQSQVTPVLAHTGLLTACRAMVDDHQTSEAHHPDHVLVPRVAFENMRAALSRGEQS